MSAPLFLYGTLRDPELLIAVLGCPLRPDALVAARAPGFRTVHYPGRAYPALIREPGEVAPGLVLMGLTVFERDLLDAYEGDEYRRATIPVLIDVELHDAFAYLPTATIPAAAAPWTLATWQETHKRQTLRTEAELAAELRTRLIAARPN